jgi:hypothetical protein
MKREITEAKKLKIAVEALKQCTQPSGAYREDRLEHAEKCIENVSRIAKVALTKIGVNFTNITIEQ